MNNRGDDTQPLLLISGPCAVESYDVCACVAQSLLAICEQCEVDFIFKASFIKANRTKGDSFRTIGVSEAIDILHTIKKEYGVRITTDVHEVADIALVQDVVDVIQIPAFLCRQTALLEAAADTGLVVNIKKGQFMSADAMGYAANKVRAISSSPVWLTERGNTFGYEGLVVDMLNVPRMTSYADRVIMDCTHATQRPNQASGVTGGNPAEIATLMRSSLAAGATGLFVETHPDPPVALSDGANMMPLDQMSAFVEEASQIFDFFIKKKISE